MGSLRVVRGGVDNLVSFSKDVVEALTGSPDHSKMTGTLTFTPDAAPEGDENIPMTDEMRAAEEALRGDAEYQYERANRLHVLWQQARAELASLRKEREGEILVELNAEGKIISTIQMCPAEELRPGTYSLIRPVEPKAKVVTGWRCRPGWVMCNGCMELQPYPMTNPMHCRECGSRLKERDLPKADHA